MKRALGPVLAIAAVLAYAACDRVVDLTPPPDAAADAAFFVPDAAPDAAEDAAVADAPSD
jgi:hypothetical protein